MSNLLMIAYKFPPMHNTSCVRTWALYSHFKEYFDKVVVISTSNRHILRNEAVEMEDAVVYDAPTYDYRTLLQGNTSKPSAVKNDVAHSKIGTIFQKLSASFPTLYIFGEGGVKYIRNAVTIGNELIERYGITHVFSTFTPYADHIIAYRFKKRFPELCWIADFRDLHIDPTQNNLLWKGMQVRRNKKILGLADIVTTVSDGLAENLAQFHPNVYTLRNGIDINTNRHYRIVADHAFTICYTGSMFGEMRDPRPVFKAVQDLIVSGEVQPEEILLEYAGKDGHIWESLITEYNLEACSRINGVVSRARALEMQSTSAVNLLLTYSTPELKGNMTGKVYEYLGSGRPLIILVNGDYDAEIDKLTETGIVSVFYTGQGEELRRKLMEMITGWRHGLGRVPVEPEMSSLEKYQWNVITGAFLDYLEESGACGAVSN